MGNNFFNEYPYTDFHELNLSWVIKELRTFATTLEQFVSINALKYADPIQWNITTQYEKNTIVIDPQSGTAYISVQPVPAGVALTNTDYWSVVFNLEQFVTKANNNFTDRVEPLTTVNATFATPLNGWLIWGGVLYKALTNIIVGDQYVVDSNIKKFTMEDITGHLEDLTTLAKTNLVAAINEVLTTLVNTTGNLSDLNTTDKTNIVSAINEVLTIIGSLSDLDTTDKTNIVSAINEILSTLTTTTGDLDNLTTTDKSNLVAAINEVDGTLSNIDIFVTPQMYGAVADGETDCTQYVEQALASGKPVYISKNLVYDRNAITQYPHDAIIYDESDGGYIRQIQNGYEGGAVNEWIFEAPYHPAILLDVNDDLNSDTPLPTQQDIVAAIAFRHNNLGKWAVRADFKFDTLRFEHFEGYKQTMILRPNNVIINNTDYSQAIVSPYTLHINGTVGQVAINQTSYNIRLEDANRDLLKLFQIFFRTTGFTFYDSTSTVTEIGNISDKGDLNFNTVGAKPHTTAEIRAFDYTKLKAGAMCFDVTLNKLVILKTVSPMVWVDANGTTVIS